MSLFPLKPTHKPVKDYYAALALFQLHGHTTKRLGTRFPHARIKAGAKIEN